MTRTVLIFAFELDAATHAAVTFDPVEETDRVRVGAFARPRDVVVRGGRPR